MSDPDPALSVLSLNVSAPTRDRARGLLELLWPAADDVWVLTETSSGEGTRLIAQVCRAAGHTVLATDPRAGGGRGVMVVGRGVEVVPDAGVPEPGTLPGRVLPVRLGGLRLAAVYGAASDPVRYSSAAQRRRKRKWIEELGGWLAAWSAPGRDGRVVVGDLNLADPGHEDALPYVLPEETAALAALEGEHGLVDAFRRQHPDRREVSWVDHSGAGCRYDHAFVDAALAPRVLACDLLHEPRTAGLSDHSAIRLVLGRRAGSPVGAASPGE